MSGEVSFVVPGDLDAPTGGNVYDRRVAAGLAAAGWRVRVRRVVGEWPRPAQQSRRALGDLLSGLGDGALVLADGLVLDGVPEVVRPHADRLRLVALVHLPLAEETGLDPAEARRLVAAERAVLAGCRAVVVTGPATVDAVTGLGVPPSRVHLVEPGVDPAPPATGTPGGGALLCVGALVPRKGQDLLVAALAGLTDLAWTCRLAGPTDRDPAYAARVAADVRRAGLSGRIEVTGSLDGPALESAYGSADLLVLPSWTETYGMVVAEALVRGLPVLTTATAAARTAAGAALVAPPGDVPALRSELARWLTDAGLRGQLGMSARAAGRTLQGWDISSGRLATVLALAARS